MTGRLANKRLEHKVVADREMSRALLKFSGGLVRDYATSGQDSTAASAP